MGYFINVPGLAQEVSSPEELEEACRKLDVGSSFHIGRTFPFNLDAFMKRSIGSPERIAIRKNGFEVEVIRDTSGSMGDLGCSCNPSGNLVPVDSLNISFRDIHDAYTDRGIVWVEPRGEHPLMFFEIKNEALKVPGLIREIAAQAEQAINERLLRLFNR